MAVIRDVMAAFELFQPTSIADVQKLLQQHAENAWIMAGGMDTFDWLKDRIRKPKVVVDLSGIDELKGIRDTSDGIEIGATQHCGDILDCLAGLPGEPVRQPAFGADTELSGDEYQITEPHSLGVGVVVGRKLGDRDGLGIHGLNTLPHAQGGILGQPP
jgi:hypothetical protein